MTSFPSHRLSRQKAAQRKRRSQRPRLHVEEFEDRIVPSYFPSTTDGIHVFEDQLPTGLSNAMVQFVATHIDGTQKELLNQTQQFRAINPNFTVLHYQLGTGNSPFDYIINDQWSSDWSHVNQQESWFAHQSYSGEPQSAADLASGRVGNSTGWDQADIANPAWQQYTLNQVLQNMAATGSNAWFADSFTYGVGGAGYDGTIPTRYQGTNAANPAAWPGGVTWTDQLANWAQTIEAAFAQYNAANGTHYQFLPNLDARATSWEPDWYDNASAVPFIDGAFLEGFGQYTDTYNWTLSMNRGLNLTANGKIVIMQPYPSADPSTGPGQQQVNFFLGTYLLLRGDATYLNIDYGGGVQYYPQYGLKLGTAVTPLQSKVSGYLWNGVYRRDFQNGFVLVNPGTTAYTLNLGGNYQLVQGTGGGTMTDADIDANGNYIGASLTYQNVNSVTLQGGSAAIFLKNTLAGATTTLATSQNPSLYGQAVTFTATVTPNGSGTPTGTVTFDDGGGAIGTGILTNGTATFNTSTLAAGTHSITAIYGGDANFSSSTSSTLSQTVITNGGTISGTVYQDYNHNGKQDPAEPGLGGQTLFIDLHGTGLPAADDPTATTDVNGNYQLTVQSPGTYTIRQVLLGGVFLATPASGSYQVTVASGANVTAQNFADVLTSIAVPLMLPPSSATAPLTLQPHTPFPKQGNANADYVEALYRSILNRDADPGGLAGWTSQLNSGAMSRMQVVQAIRTSTEHFTNEVTDFYFTILRRPPDPSGLQGWVQALQNRIRTEEQVAFAFFNSSEYLSKGDKYFVDQVYLALLGRAFDASGEASWLYALGDDASGNPTHPPLVTHQAVITGFLYSQESLTRLVDGFYQVFLQRLADAAGLSGWVGALRQGASFWTIGEQILSSAEFYHNAAAQG
jgi:Bacterial Ig-like domain (group 3)/Hypothetical glycosyl hydrolase family 15/Domain of unknown function (DUF4214)/SdrD B-like domain